MPWRDPVDGREAVFDRRELFRRAGATTVAVGGAAVLGGLASGCTPTDTPTASTRAEPSTTASGDGPPDWKALSASLDGSLVLPSDPSYAVDRRLYNRRFDDIAPAAIAYCTTPTDVRRCVDFARRHGVTMAARSGGHCFGGYSSCRGLVADVTPMASVTVAADRASATVGAGARLIDVYEALGSAGVLLPGGSCPTVGIAGLTLGGGAGVFGRNYGLTCDQLTAVDLVTADGRQLRCDAGHHADLFWACRGGGGGNFGVATSFTFRVHPIPPISLFTLEWPWAAAGDVLAAWQSWMPTTAPPLWTNCQLLAGAGSLRLRVTGVYCGAAATLARALAPLRTAVGASPAYDFVGPEDYLRAMLIEAGCEGSTVAQCHLPSQDPAGVLSRASFVAKSAYVPSALPDAGVAAVVDAVASLVERVPAAGGGFVFDSYGGAINRVAPDATAFVHRHELAGVQFSATWTAAAPPSVEAAAAAWLDGAAAAVAPFVRGAYQNYIDPALADWEQAYYGANLRRLVRVKRATDPDDFFHFAQSIPTTLRRD